VAARAPLNSTLEREHTDRAGRAGNPGRAHLPAQVIGGSTALQGPPSARSAPQGCMLGFPSKAVKNLLSLVGKKPSVPEKLGPCSAGSCSSKGAPLPPAVVGHLQAVVSCLRHRKVECSIYFTEHHPVQLKTLELARLGATSRFEICRHDMWAWVSGAAQQIGA